ncbi:family 43 glycosylhydrolase [Paenibacillus typhae]|uniref:family 43 glycosylhydrolase n=1 Tax=Paenibacillus typhae TaxID=1174501 RepID=UPI001C8DD7E6|nr:family 43 glycosylhydrolase [Paenibacillus typhae]MBY0010993.1 family 43 glycosylhydrolase [Paenibacillus typhae]
MKVKARYMWLPAVSVLAIGVLLVLTMGKVGHKVSSHNDFYNVVMQDGADPWVYKHTDGFYYFTKTTGGNVTLWKSAQLTTIDAGQVKVISTGGSSIWAPELHYLNGAWYIYYAMDDGDNVNHRMHVMESTAADPLEGTWQYKGQITDPSDKWAIDGTVLQAGEELYFIWSGWEGDVNVRQNLYIAHMSNPWSIDSERVEIARPTYSWETNHSPNVNEGPQVIIQGNIISLVYSASGSWTDDYCLGLITADISADLLNPASWNKRSQPVFSSGNGLYGPGHHSFAKSPDGREDWIMYHVAKYSGAGWNREVRMQPFSWNADNTPALGIPADPNLPVTLPSGEAAHQRYEGEEAAFGGAAYASSSQNSSGGMKAGHIDTPESYVEFSVKAEEAGQYILLARTANGTAGGGWSHLLLSVNSYAPSHFNITNKGWENWGLSTARIQLNAGTNTLRFAKGDGYGEIDFIDIKPAD